MTRGPFLPFLLLLLAASLAGAQDILTDESILFGDTSSITDSASLAAEVPPGGTGERKSVGFSGGVLTVGQAGLGRGYFGSPDIEESDMAAAAVGTLALDVRLLRGYKAFADLEWSYDPNAAGITGDTGTAFRVPEIFLDANIGRRVYFRAGKQVLQWGRTYFFNPTDLVNVERKSFFRRIGAREGVFGLKAHAPFGTAWNLYGFLDAHGVTRPDSVAAALRVERLLGRTEMSLMVWDRLGSLGRGRSVYGADLSTRLLGLDLDGELALHQEFTVRSVTFPGGAPAVASREEDWAPRASLGLGRTWRVQGIQDRLITVGEYYYNGPGDDDRRLGLASFLTTVPGAGLTGSGVAATLARTGFYGPDSYSRHYAAVFATFNRFLRRPLTLTVNAIGNLNQRCALVSSGISYADLNDFALSLWVNGFAGPEDTEYTLAGQGVQVQAIAEAAF